MRKATQPVRLQPSRNSKSKKDTVTGNDTGNKIPSRIRNTNKTEILPSPFSPSLSSNSPCTKYMSPRDKFESIHPKLLFEQSSSPISAKSRNAKDSIDTTIKAKQSDGEVASQLALRELSDKVNEIQNSQSIILDTIKNIAEALTQLKDAFHEDKTNLQKQTLVKLEDIASTSEKNNDQISQLTILQEATKKEATLVEDSNERKQEIAFQWDQMRKSRKRCYWNVFKNKAKSELYKEWQSNSPDFLPLKYRPKIVGNEPPDITIRRLDEARLRYINDTQIMLSYSDIHSDRVQEIDKKAFAIIASISKNENEKQQIFRSWKQDAATDEALSRDSWSRHEAFLRRKKHEDTSTKRHQLSDLTWEEILHRRHGPKVWKQKPEQRNEDKRSAVTMETT